MSINFKTAAGILALFVVFSIGAIGYWVLPALSAIGLESGYQVDPEPEPRLLAPVWSPDGAYIVFWLDEVIYTVDVDGSRLQRFKEGRHPSFSPDGSRIAYSVYHKDNWNITAAKPDGSDQLKLTNNKWWSRFPVWSSDGTIIFFESNDYPYTIKGIYAMPEDGSGSRSTVVEYSDLADAIVLDSDLPPVLSPSGNHLAFVVEVMDVGRVMYVVKVDGSGLMRLEYETSRPTWSPDGRRLAFAKREPGDRNYRLRTADGLYTIGRDGSKLKQIVSFPSRQVVSTDSISWSPDGSEILFGTMAIALDRSSTRALPGPGYHSSWSPDGRRIAVFNHRRRESAVVLYTVARDGSDPRILVEFNEEAHLAGGESRPLPE